MRIYNSDGSEPEMCGNGIRCLARFLADRDGDGPGRTWQIDTLAGRIVPELLADGTIRVDMGAWWSGRTGSSGLSRSRTRLQTKNASVCATRASC